MNVSISVCHVEARLKVEARLLPNTMRERCMYSERMVLDQLQ